ncbi:MAG: hypothetical protein ABI597_00575 [Gammaproteobacteria bacterium]
MSTSTLDMTPDGRSFIRKLSSSKLQLMIFEFYFWFDILPTFLARYPRLVSSDIPQDKTTNGAFIDWTSKNPIAAVVTLVGCFALACASSYAEYTRQKRVLDNNSYQAINGELAKQGQFKAMEDAIKEDEETATEEEQIAWLQASFKQQLEEDAELSKKYESITIEYNEEKKIYQQKFIRKKKQVEQAIEKEEIERVQRPSGRFRTFVNKYISPVAEFVRPVTSYISRFTSPITSFLNKKIVSPIWQALGIASFTYWLFYIGTGLFTGTFDTGIAGLSPWIGFGIPIAIGVSYIALKAINYVRSWLNKPAAAKDQDPEEVETAEERAEAMQDAAKLMHRSLLARKFELATKGLMFELGPKYRPYVPLFEKGARISSTMDKELDYLNKDHGYKTAAEFVSTTWGTYIGVQYGAWIVTDMLSKLASVTSAIPIVNLICGAAFIGVSVLNGIYKAAARYTGLGKTADEANLKNQSLEAASAAQSLEDILIEKREANNDLRRQLKAKKGNLEGLPKCPVQFDEPQFFGDVTRDGPSKWTKVKKFAKRSLTFINAFTGGAFVARIIFVKGTAIFLPFVAVAGGPWTIPVLVGIGLLYGVFKLWEYHVKQKEQRSKDLLAQHEEHVQCLKKDIEHEDLVGQVLQKRLDETPDVAPNEASAPDDDQQEGAAPNVKYGQLYAPAKPAANDPEPAPPGGHVYHQLGGEGVEGAEGEVIAPIPIAAM